MNYIAFKEWFFLGLIALLYTAFLFVSGIVYRISKSFVSQINEKMDKLIEEVRGINLSNVLLKREIEIIQSREKEIRETCKNCENFKPRR